MHLLTAHMLYSPVSHWAFHRPRPQIEMQHFDSHQSRRWRAEAWRIGPEKPLQLARIPRPFLPLYSPAAGCVPVRGWRWTSPYSEGCRGRITDGGKTVLSAWKRRKEQKELECLAAPQEMRFSSATEGRNESPFQQMLQIFKGWVMFFDLNPLNNTNFQRKKDRRLERCYCGMLNRDSV